LCCCISADYLHTAFSISAASYNEQKEDLEKLQKRISNLQKQIRKDIRLRDESQSLLQTIDLDIAKTQSALDDNNKLIEKSQFRIKALAAEEQAALSAMGDQQQQLAAILKLAHKNQKTPVLKLFLDEKTPTQLARHMTYYKYLMQAQEGQINAITAEVRNFVSLLDTAKKEQIELTNLQEKDTQNLQKLEKSRSQRQVLVKQLAANIKTQSVQVEQLEEQEETLNKIINELSKTLERFPDNTLQSFKKLRGTLTWPVAGTIQHRFGQYRVSGQKVRWKGVFIKSERNIPIKAVAYGRVVYADWLPGMGLIAIVDHGDDYFSMYASAEILYKEVGAWVQTGDIIATTGDSGGNKSTGLYFEIRRGKTSLNPSPWFKNKNP